MTAPARPLLGGPLGSPLRRVERPGPGWREVWLRSDWGLLVGTLGLSLVGILLVASASHRTAGMALAARQLVALVIGLGLALAVSAIGTTTLRRATPAAYVLAMLGLVAVASPLGTTVNGSHSWIMLPGGFSVQPSELAKVGLVLALAAALRPVERRGVGTRQVVTAALLGLLPVGLVMLQPDLGSALVLVALTLGVLACSGASRWWVLLGAGAVGAAAVAAVQLPVLSAYQRERLLAFLDPGADPTGFGYQTRQVRIAIGSGGWFGEGLFAGRQTQGGFVPFQHSDFVFSVAGEELGFVGSALLLGIVGFVVVRALLVALRADDPGSRLVAAGVAAWFAFQTFENVGMNLGLMPVTGLPLPFLSYGGSSMMASWLAIGLVNQVHVTSRGPLAPRPTRR